MGDIPDFDLSAAHKYFSAVCFNMVWELLDRTNRSEEEDEQMVRLCLASHWHWTQREDYSPVSASVAYWQTARVYAVLGQAANARKYGLKCLEVSQNGNVPPFYLGYAFEALARAEMVAGEDEKMQHYLKDAGAAAERVSDPDERKWLEDDLATIQ